MINIKILNQYLNEIEEDNLIAFDAEIDQICADEIEDAASALVTMCEDAYEFEDLYVGMFDDFGEAVLMQPLSDFSDYSSALNILAAI